MIEQGLLMQIQSGLGSPPLAPMGFAGQLPKDYQGMTQGAAYVYSVIDDQPDTGLQFTNGLVMRVFQFDCYGANALTSMTLAKLLDGAINGFGQARLSDPDSTYVSICKRIYRNGPKYSDAVRNFWIMLRYRVWYSDTI